jgi:hypothetical protein
MSSNRFINERKGAWQRLEDLLTLLDRMSLRRLHREEVRELGRIYRRTSSDLAIARAESRDPRLVNYLNSLVIRAHGRIYRAGRWKGGRRACAVFRARLPADVSAARGVTRPRPSSSLWSSASPRFWEPGATRSFPNSRA